jgi:hypothetical protein
LARGQHLPGPFEQAVAGGADDSLVEVGVAPGVAQRIAGAAGGGPFVDEPLERGELGRGDAGGRPGGGQSFEHRAEQVDVLDVGRTQLGEIEAPPGSVHDQAVVDEAEERLPHRREAHPEGFREGGLAQPRTRPEPAGANLLEQIGLDRVAQPAVPCQRRRP